MNHSFWKFIIILPVLGVGLAIMAKTPSSRLSQDWAQFGHDYSENHFSSLDQINRSSVNRLGLAWYRDIPTTGGGVNSGPLAVGGVVYYTTGFSVVTAVDGTNGRLLWEYDPEVYKRAGLKLRVGMTGVRGIAYLDGRIFTGTLDGRLIALDAKSGRVVWSTLTVDPKGVGYISGPPWAFNGKVVIGQGGADFGPLRGYVTAYDAATGKQVWRFYTVPGNPADGFENKAMEQAAKTWTGEWWKFGGGGNVWHAMAYDLERNVLYLGTGNGSPWNRKIRSPGGGDNLYLSSIVALNADTGEYLWHYQENPGETWDYNSNQDIELTDLYIDGRKRPVLLHAPKNGFFYVIDRETGKLLSATQVAKVNWASGIDMATGRPIENPEARYPDGKTAAVTPGIYAHGIAAMSFNPLSRLVYLPVTEQWRYYTDPPGDLKAWKPQPGMQVSNVGVGDNPPGLKPLPKPESFLIAWDPVAKKAKWKLPMVSVTNSGTMTTGGMLLFQGHANGEFLAYDANEGKKLWSFDAQVGVQAQPITYAIDGVQYVAVLAGWRGTKPNGNGHEWEYRFQKRRLLVFALDGKKKLPSERYIVVPIVDDPRFKIDSGLAAAGESLFGNQCTLCHGPGAVAGGAAPDLRKSQIPLSTETFTAIVHDGALESQGMPSFAEFSSKDILALQHYIRREARVGLSRHPTKLDAETAPPPVH